MKYMLLIYHNEQEWDALNDAARQKIYLEYRDLVEELASAGKYLAGDELQSTATAQSVRIRDGQELITDGPFAETREQVGGFFLIEARDFDEAKRIAARIPTARTGTIEVRPVNEMESEKAASA